jgi:pimeloyl-ACP methyl ester carboxylesterase
MIAVELAARYPALPSALVLVDPGPIDPPPDEVDYYRAFAEQLEGADGEAIRREYVGNFGTRDGGIADWIVDHMCRVEQPIAAAVIRGVTEWNGREPFSRCRLPILLLRAGIEADTDVLRLLEIKPDLEIAITNGAGHFHQLEVPKQVNAMIERFLDVGSLTLRSGSFRNTGPRKRWLSSAWSESPSEAGAAS